MDRYRVELFIGLACAACILWVATTLRKEAPAPIVRFGASPAALNVPHWYVDTQNVSTCASDGNSGTSATCGTAGVGPLVHVAEIARRWGSLAPVLTVGVTVTVLSDCAVSDPWMAQPTLNGAGGLLIQGVPQVVATATLGTYVPVNFAAATKPTITAVGQTGAYWTPYAGSIVHDTTVNASFIVDADLGTARAAITTPFALPMAEVPTGTATIANGDTLQILKMPLFFATALDSNNIGDLTGTVTQAHLSQVTLSASAYELVIGANIYVTDSVVNAFFLFSMNRGLPLVPIFTGCAFGTTGINGSFNLFGGDSNAAGDVFQNYSSLDGDVYINQRLHWTGVEFFWRRAYFGQTNTVDNALARIDIFQSSMADSARAPRIWGPAGLQLTNGTSLTVANATMASALLLTGPLQIDGSATAWPWVAGSNAYGAPVTITAAAVDANGALGNPASGSRILIGH